MPCRARGSRRLLSRPGSWPPRRAPGRVLTGGRIPVWLWLVRVTTGPVAATLAGIPCLGSSRLGASEEATGPGHESAKGPMTARREGTTVGFVHRCFARPWEDVTLEDVTMSGTPLSLLGGGQAATDPGDRFA